MLTVHHLNESRSQRILWLLEELDVPYEIKFYNRDPITRLAPPELKAIHPLGKSPVVTEGDLTVFESGAIISYIIRRHGGGRLAPDPSSKDYDRYVSWLHYAEGSAMLPLMVNMYVMRLGEGGAALQPRITSEIDNHIGYVNASLEGRDYLVGDSLTGADVNASFVAEVTKAFGRLDEFPNLKAWIGRLHARPAWKKALEKGGPYALGA